jgi:signal transduction histidine kinase
MQNTRHLGRLVTHSLEELQRLIADLRPSHLDDLGLPAALRWYSGEVQSRTPLTVSVEVTGPQRPLGPALNTALFRMAQEALTNTVKHAQADHAWIRLHYGPETIVLEAEDDGQGFDPARCKQMGAWGLLGLEERANLLEGRLEITSDSRRGGTLIRATFPYNSAERANDGNQTPAG